MNYKNWIYGILMGLSLLLLDIVNYRTIARQLSMEVYGTLIAIIFLLVGLWIGFQGISLKNIRKNSYKKIEDLSKRENEVLIAMAEGLTNKEIAEKLFVSENTVKTHVSNILSKMHVQRRTQAILKAKEMELVTPTKE